MKKGTLYSIVSAILFGSAGIIIKLAFNEGIDPVGLLTLQYILAVSLMFIVLWFWGGSALKISKRDLFHTAVLGIVGNTFMTVFYYMAFSYLSVPVVSILLYTYPIIIFIYTFFFDKGSITLGKLIALAVAFVGCYFSLGLTNAQLHFSLKGLVCGLLSAVFYAFMNIYSDKNLSHVNSISINFYATVFSLLSLIIYRFPTFIFNGGVNPKTLGYTLSLAIICEIIPLTLLYAAIKRIGALRVSIIGNLEIPTSMLLSYVLLHQSVTILQILGAAAVISAICIIRK